MTSKNNTKTSSSGEKKQHNENISVSCKEGPNYLPTELIWAIENGVDFTQNTEKHILSRKIPVPATLMSPRNPRN